MATSLHKDLIASERHAAHSFEYADASAREGASGMLSTDVGKLARQIDDNTIWILTDDSPVTWAQVGGNQAGGISEESHRALKQLIHYLDSGPDSSAYKEATPTGSAFPTAIIWWTNSGKTVKIAEKLITWSGAFPTAIVWKVYDGASLVETITDTYDYTGGNTLTPKVTRVLS
jgi:hypothetical protein